MKRISILGTGCPKCKKLIENAETAVRELAIEAELEKVTDVNEIMKFGVMMTPVLVIDGKVQSPGRVLSVKEIKELLAGEE